MPDWLRILIALAMAGVILWVGLSTRRGFRRPPPDEEPRDEPEEVEDLEVYFVCGECGTEYKVTKLGELSVPRHCGEPMQVVRRPAQDPTLN